MTHIRKGIALLVLAATLAFPVSTFAVSASASTDESLTVATLITLTVPASVTYTGPVTDKTVTIAAIVTSTTNPTGLALSVSSNAAGSGLIDPATRWADTPAVTGNLTAWASPLALGSFPGGGNIATSASSGSGTASSVFHVNANAYAPGVYTGTLTFTATTN
jgi:hypothetical protein